jgi:hypothetical protein
MVWICNIKTEPMLKHFEWESNIDYYNVLFWHILYNDLNKDRNTSGTSKYIRIDQTCVKIFLHRLKGIFINVFFSFAQF